MKILVDKEVHEAQKAKIVYLEFRLAQLEKMIFGRKSERYKHFVDPQQLSLLPESKKSAPQVPPIEDCRLLQPLYNLLKQKILETDYLMVDETTFKVQEDCKGGKCYEGWFWLYEDPLSKLVIYDYQKDRSSVNPLDMLKDFTGHIQVDGYSSYRVVERQLPVTLLSCWAHARRKFVEAYDYDKIRCR